MSPVARLHRWDEIELERVTEMVSRKVVSGDGVMVAQVYLKRGALVPRHRHDSEQLVYVLEGALRAVVDDEETIVRAGEVLWVPARVPHQAEALDDTLELDIFSPIRRDWVVKSGSG